ncbi:aconitase family-domain-containing protein [Dichotomopilus funicola]|uniref:3-isopropylmalate dehydratase n=1 Tax=Dichotomopilus funicola TaxID=1934379 RepID=A0AAN6ZJK0_9PEZI|nr:aconitase family-domain-containing protein [Dichotomopilus funicola]
MAATKPRTLYDKLFEEHVAAEQDNGAVLLYIDRHLVHEVSSPQAFAGLKAQDRPVRRPELTLATCDHNVPTTPRPRVMKVAQAKLQVETLARNVKIHNIPYLGLNSTSQGIVHVIGPELGFTLPGTTVVCGDSHTSTHGAFGCLAFGIGTSEVEHVLATQTVVTTRWKSMRVWVTGELAHGVGSKDLMLYIIGQIGTAAGTGAAIEFAGPTIESLTMEARMSLCNMAIEAGARAGLIAPDETTFAYLQGRPLVPENEGWEQATAYWRTLQSDPDAVFDRQWNIDATNVAPIVSWGTSPEQVTPITGIVPSPEDFQDPSKADSCRQALKYMGLEPGTKMTDITIDKIFIGSCTNSRLSDLRAAASILLGRHIAPTIKAAYVVPGSGVVKKQAEAEGLDKIFTAAGFEWREAGCSMCVGLNEDQLDAYERSASTSNRNFENRQGTAGRTHLMSPVMAAAAAIDGRLSDARKYLGGAAVAPETGILQELPTYPQNVEPEDTNTSEQQGTADNTNDDDDTIAAGPFTSVSGLVAPLDRANVDTDCILPKQFCTTIVRRGLRDGLFHNLRWRPDGSVDDTFVLNRAPYAPNPGQDVGRASILLCTGPNFGCGSSREHAVWALLDYGIRVVLATSFGDIFYGNSFKNGLLPALVSAEDIPLLQAEAEAGHELEVVLATQQIRRVATGEEIARFEVDKGLKEMLLAGVDEIGLSLRRAEDIARYEAARGEARPWLTAAVQTGWDRLNFLLRAGSGSLGCVSRIPVDLA